MREAGFSDYSQFIRAIFSAVQRHAVQADWLPVYWNIGDEPIGDDLVQSAENAEEYRKAFPRGAPFFTGASSFRGADAKDPHFRLSRALHVADWNDHDPASVKLLHEAGGDWAFYNGGSRWTYGIYMYKAAKQHRMKFRVSWHWNNVAGDPYYALDCREDDYAWCNSSPDGELIPSVEFERLREGLGDYRRPLDADPAGDGKRRRPCRARGGEADRRCAGELRAGRSRDPGYAKLPGIARQAGRGDREASLNGLLRLLVELGFGHGDAVVQHNGGDTVEDAMLGKLFYIEGRGFPQKYQAFRRDLHIEVAHPRPCTGHDLAFDKFFVEMTGDHISPDYLAS